MQKQETSLQPAIILVHGFRGSPIGLKAIGEELEKHGYQVFIPSIAPFGGADKIASYTPEAYAKYLVDFAKTNHLEKPILIGHSMGSIIVAATTSLYPDVFNKKAVLLSPISKRPAAPFRLISPLSALLPSSLIDYLTTKFLFVPHDKKLFEQTLAITHDCSNDQPPLKSEVFEAAKFSTRYAVGSFTPSENSEVLLLAGENDRLIPKSQTLQLAQTLGKNAKVQTTFLKNTGHLHNYEQPRETTQAIIEFLKTT